MYLLFAGYNYYPGGGMNDFHGQYVSIEAAKDHIIKNKIVTEWAHIVDKDTLETVWSI